MIGLINLNLLKLNLAKLSSRGAPRQRPTRSALLGLALDGRRLEGFQVRRVNGSVRLQPTVSASLELNLLTDDPELVGREIRNHLDRAGIRERHCSVCIPLEWTLTAHVPVPELPPEDVESFLALEAERSFPFPQENLALASSRCRGAQGGQFATLIAIPKDHLTTLQSVLKAAQLKPVSFSLGLPTMQDPSDASQEGVAALAVGGSGVQLQICAGGGVAALRTLPGALEQDGARKTPYVDVVARDLRITLGQLPGELRKSVRRLRIFGQGDDLGRFVEDLTSRAQSVGLEVESVRTCPPRVMGFEIPPGSPISPSLSLALRLLAGQPAVLEFLPPKVGRWKQVTSRYSSQKLVAAVGIAGVVLFLTAGAFLWQQWQLGRWGARWQRIRPQVTQLEDMQNKIRQFRPWFDSSFRSLSILEKITEAFPEDGSVFAKTVEIREPGVISCSGTARDQQALLKVVDQLRASQHFSTVQVDQIRGKLFTINLNWSGGSNP